METAEQKQQALTIAGEGLTFSFGTILGFPGEEVNVILGLDSPYDIKQQKVEFQITSEDFFAHVIVEGDTFSYKISAKTYTFKIIEHREDLAGWVNLKCGFVSRV